MEQAGHCQPKKTETEALLKFIKSRKNHISLAEITSFFTGKLTTRLSDVYSSQIDVLLDPFISSKKLDQKSIDTLTKEIPALIKRIEKWITKERDLIFVSLGHCKSLSPAVSYPVYRE